MPQHGRVLERRLRNRHHHAAGCGPAPAPPPPPPHAPPAHLHVSAPHANVALLLQLSVRAFQTRVVLLAGWRTAECRISCTPEEHGVP